MDCTNCCEANPTIYSFSVNFSELINGLKKQTISKEMNNDIIIAKILNLHSRGKNRVGFATIHKITNENIGYLESGSNAIKPAGSSLANSVTVTTFAAGSMTASEVSTRDVNFTVKLL